jgi:sigma-B regulation protein RsbQ
MNPDRLRINNVTVTGNLNAAQTLLFAHGFGSNQKSWRHITPCFEKQYRLVLMDVVGCGSSEASAFNAVRYGSLDGFVDDLIEICDALGLHQAIGIGHSASAMSLVLAAERRPELFAKLVLISVSPRYLNESGYSDSGNYRGGFEKKDLDEIFMAMATDFLGWTHGVAPIAMNSPDQPLLASEFAQSIARMRPQVALTTMRTILQIDHRRELERITVSTLAIQADEDLFVPETVNYYLQRQGPHLRVNKIAAKGHFPHMSHPRETGTAILEFIQIPK